MKYFWICIGFIALISGCVSENVEELNRRVGELDKLNKRLTGLLEKAIQDYDKGAEVQEIIETYRKEVISVHKSMNLELQDMTQYCMDNGYPQQIQFEYLEKVDFSRSQSAIKALKEVGVVFAFEKFE